MERKELKAAGKLLTPLLHVGKEGMTPGIVAQLDKELRAHRLVKVRVLPSALPEEAGKPERKALAAALATAVHAEVIDVVGSVVVLHRR